MSCDACWPGNCYGKKCPQTKEVPVPKKEPTHGFPKELVVKRENADTKDEYLRAETNPSVIAEVGESVIVGVYKLIRTEIVTAPIARHPTWMGMKVHRGNKAA